MPEKNEIKATVTGLGALLIWGFLALLTNLSGNLPPFQIVSMSFAVAFFIYVCFWNIKKSKPLTMLKQPLSVWGIGIFGIFGYHFFLFMALKNAPVMEANLINYMWPLLTVLFSAFLPNEKLRWFHIAGVLTGFAGCVLIVTKGKSWTLETEYIFGYSMALLASLTWSSYSVMLKRFKDIRSDFVGWLCGASSILGTVCHFIFEQTVIPENSVAWFSVLCLGIGPLGAAFFMWDYGIKHGNIKVLGASAYITCLISTSLLVVFGQAEFSINIIIACFAIIGGAVLAAGEYLPNKKQLSNKQI